MKFLVHRLFQTPAIAVAIALSALVHAPATMARDNITVVGSSTVYPFVTVAAENFGRDSRFRTPRIEATGTGGGLKLFCAGLGPKHADIANASRRIKHSEFARCLRHGVTDIIEIKLGFDGIVIANARTAPSFNLSLRDMYLALAKQTPQPSAPATMVANPYRTWRDVRDDLPATRIEMLGPPPTSGTRDAFVELAMEGGCQTFAHLKKMKAADKKQYQSLCHTLREDGGYVEAGENDNLIVQKLVNNPTAVGIFGFSFLDQNRDVVKGLPIDDVPPTFEAISDGRYAVSRSLYMYVKKQHIGAIAGLQEFILTITSFEAAGRDGYLSARGLIPLADNELATMQKRVRELEVMQETDL